MRLFNMLAFNKNLKQKNYIEVMFQELSNCGPILTLFQNILIITFFQTLFMHFATTNISQDLSRYILNKASKRYCYQNSKKESFVELTKEQARHYTQQCSNIVMNLYNFRTNTQQRTLGSEDILLSPACHQKKHHFQYTADYISPQQSSSPSVKNLTAKRIGRLTVRPKKAKYTSNCLPLQITQQNDENIEYLRKKKQKLHNLQSFFKRTQQSQKIKYKFQKPSKNLFTTDYNGDKIQFKRLIRPINMDSYLTIDINMKVREERQQNERFMNFQNNSSFVKLDHNSKQNSRNMQSRKTAPLSYKNQSKLTVSQASNKTIARPSTKLEHITQKDTEKDTKSQKSRFQKLKANTANISSIDFIKSF